MSDPVHDEREVESLLRARPAPELPPRLSSDRLWREVQARRQPRSVPVLPARRPDARLLVGLAWAPEGR